MRHPSSQWWRYFAGVLGAAFLFVAVDRYRPTAARNQETRASFRYDGRGRVIERTEGARVLRMTYDRLGQVAAIRHFKLGWLTRWAYPAGDDVRFTHDLAGNLTAVESPSGRVTYEYDKLNRPASRTATDGSKLAYELDPWDRVTRMALSGGVTVKSHFDLQNRVVHTQGGGAGVRNEYDGRTVTRHLSNGVVSSFEHDGAGRLVEIRHRDARGAILAAFHYQYDGDSRVERVEESTASGTVITQYAYDPLGRLIRVVHDGRAVGYEYDAMGNRRAEVGPGGRKESIYDAAGRLVRAGDITLAYDAFGNVVSKEGGGRWAKYRYDQENRLIEVRSNSGRVRYAYDGEGNRVRRESGGRATTYVHDTLGGLPRVAAVVEQGMPAWQYVFGPSRLARVGAAGVHYLLEDRLGSTRVIVDGGGKVVARYQYSPFGAPERVDGNASESFLFESEPWDAETGLIHLRARDYDPELGRFLSPDPISGSITEPQSFNRYVYAQSDPVNKVDPTGLATNWMPPPPPPPPYYYDPNRMLYDLRRQSTWQLFRPPALPPADPFTTRPNYLLPWRLEHPFAWQPATVSYWRPAFPETRLEQLDRLQRENGFMPWSWSKALADQTRQGWLTAHTPFQHDLRGVAYATTFIPGAGQISSWALYGNEAIVHGSGHRWRELGLHSALQGVDLYGASSHGRVGQAAHALGRGVHGLEMLNEFRQGAAYPFLLSFARDLSPRRSEDRLDLASRYAPLIGGGPLDRTRNIFFPPPPGGGGGGGGFPLVGGVYLDQAATVLGSLGAIRGAMIDPKTGQLILVGDNSTTLPPMKPEYLAAAIRAVYSESPYEPGMTIDPMPGNPHSPVMLVRFFANTEKTRLGWVMFEADRVMKTYSVGRDNITKEPVQSSVPGYRSVTEMLREDGHRGPKLWSRFWLVPDPIAAQVSADGRTITYAPIKMRVKTETMRWEGGKLVSAGGIKDAHAEAFAAHFTANYDAFAKENPIYAELKQVTQAVALAKWMRQQGVPVDWNLVHVLGEPFDTPETTPAAYNEFRDAIRDGRGEQVGLQMVASFGGVEMEPEIVARKSAAASKVGADLTRAAAEAQKQGRSSFTVEIEGKSETAVVLPRANQREAASYSLVETDLTALLPAMDGLPGLTRSYDSLHNESSELGRSWSLLLPRLQFEAAGEKGRSEYVSVAGAGGTQVLLQRFTLTNDFGLGQERFSEHYIDEGLRRIGFRPAESGAFRGIFPEGEGLYRLFFVNDDQAIFDSAGRLRVMFHGGAKAVYDYDHSGRLVTIELRQGSERRLVVKLEHDATGRIVAVDGNGDQAVYHYDARGNLSEVRRAGQVVSYAYDSKRLLTQVAIGGKVVVRNFYDAFGHLIGQRDFRGGDVRQQVQALPDGGRVVTVESDNDTVTQTYDRELRLVRRRTSDGAVFQYSYSSKGAVERVETTLPNDGRSHIELSPDGKLQAALDPRGVRTNYRYEPGGALAAVSVDGEQMAAFRYDSQSRLTGVRHSAGAEEEYQYDGSGRLQSYRRQQHGITEELELAYDAAGNLTAISDGKDRTPSIGQSPDIPDLPRPSMRRTEDGAVVYRAASGAETRYSFGGQGQRALTAVRDAGGKVTAYDYDAAKRLERVRLPGGACVRFEYDRKGRVVTEIYEPAVVRKRSGSRAGRAGAVSLWGTVGLKAIVCSSTRNLPPVTGEPDRLALGPGRRAWSR